MSTQTDSTTSTTSPDQPAGRPTRRNAKAALAAAAAAVLLLGGAGSLAYWNDTESILGTPINAGELKLGTPNCGTGWLLNGLPLLPTTLIVPGAVLTKVCSIDLVATGVGLEADLGISSAAFGSPNNLTSELVPSALFTVSGATKNHITSADDTGTLVPEISSTIKVTFTGGTATNASQALSAVLNAVSVTATQTSA